MSEFTDYMQVLTDAETLSDLKGHLVETVGSAVVPLYELPTDSLQSPEAAETAWQALIKPVWVMVQTDGSVERLAGAGPAFHLMVEEDFQTWAIALHCKGQSWGVAVLQEPDVYREVTLQADVANWDPTARRAETETMAACLSVNVEALSSAFVADGGRAFSALIGAHYEQMEDQGLSDFTPGEVRLANWD